LALSWSEPISLYCERTGPTFWAEPVNALTNAAFLVAAALALVLWFRQPQRDPASAALIAATALIGAGSFAFHTLATRGAVLLDVVPIALFVYGYLFLALRRWLRLGAAAAIGILAGFVLVSRGLAFALPPGVLNGSLEYLPPLAALIVVGVLVGAGPIRRAILSAAVAFLISLIFRTVDRSVCDVLPLGTHFVWHLLNAVVLFILLRTAVQSGNDTH